MNRIIGVRYLGHQNAHSSIVRQAARCLQEMQREIEHEKSALRKRLAKKLSSFRINQRQRAERQARSLVQGEYAERLLNASRAYVDAVKNSQRDCLDLALSIAEEITAEHISTDSSTLSSRISTELQRLQEDARVTLKMHPNTADLLKDQISELSAFPLSQVKACSEIAPDVVELHTRSGTVLIDWKIHFERIASCLRTTLAVKS